jgi:hypothetical protein
MPRRAYGLLLAMLALPSIAFAQGPEVSIGVPSPAAEFTAAFSLDDPKDVNLRPTCLQLSLPCSSGKEFGDYGWSLSAGYSFTDNVAVVGEFCRVRELLASSPSEPGLGEPRAHVDGWPADRVALSPCRHARSERPPAVRSGPWRAGSERVGLGRPCISAGRRCGRLDENRHPRARRARLPDDVGARPRHVGLPRSSGARLRRWC